MSLKGEENPVEPDVVLQRTTPPARWENLVAKGFARLALFPIARVQKLAEDHEGEVAYYSVSDTSLRSDACSERIPRTCAVVTLRSTVVVDGTHPRFVADPLPDLFLAPNGVLLPDSLGEFVPARVQGRTIDGRLEELSCVVIWVYAHLISGPVELSGAVELGAEGSIGAVLVFFTPLETLFVFHDAAAKSMVLARVKSRARP